jgi:hypothetical protein
VSSYYSIVHSCFTRQPSHASFFSDEDVIEDNSEEDGEEKWWEQVDFDEAEMAKKEASPSPAPRTPGKTTPAPKKTQSIASIEKDMKTMLVADAPKFVPFNFNHRYILCAPLTSYLEDGTH